MPWQTGGAGHWPTGTRGSSHITVRAIELHREHIPADDPLMARCAAALERTVAHPRRPVTLRLDGLTLIPSGVMACAYPIGSAADDFSAQLGAELGPDAWFEDQYDRNIWYVMTGTSGTSRYCISPARSPIPAS